jgi:hypothetical protein
VLEALGEAGGCCSDGSSVEEQQFEQRRGFVSSRRSWAAPAPPQGKAASALPHGKIRGCVMVGSESAPSGAACRHSEGLHDAASHALCGRSRCCCRRRHFAAAS